MSPSAALARAGALVILVAAGCAASPRAAPAPAVEAPEPGRARRPAPPPCEAPELWLAVSARDALPAAYCAACASSCSEDDGGGEPAMRWGLLQGDPLRFGCFDLEYASLAIPAYHGAPAPPRWADHFAGLSWYRPDGRVRLDEMPAVARDNQIWMTAAAEICMRTLRFTYAAAYLEPIRRWFADRDRGRPELPGLLFVDGEPATRRAFLEFLDQSPADTFRFRPRTPVAAEAAPAWWRERLGVGDRTLIMVTVSTGAPSLSCVDRSGIDCEGFESIDFFFAADSAELVALHLTASG
jgi:hypothetical protein